MCGAGRWAVGRNASDVRESSREIRSLARLVPPCWRRESLPARVCHHVASSDFGLRGCPPGTDVSRWSRPTRTPRDWAAIGIAIAWLLFAGLLLAALWKVAETPAYGRGPETGARWDPRTGSVALDVRQSLPE